MNKTTPHAFRRLARAGLVAVSLLALAVPLAVDAAASDGPGQQATAGSTRATGMIEVALEVDGLACPFCAYGIEKKVKEVANVESIEVRVSEGIVVVHPQEGTAVDLAALGTAVHDAGFTPRGISLAARGQVIEYQGTPALALPNDIVLLLDDGARTDELLAAVEAGSDTLVRVQGTVDRDMPAGHAGHPYTLHVESFRVA